MEAFWQTSKSYRSKVRASLIRAGLLDDPDKPKKLSEAIDFKGTCEDMCPEFEKITRIVEHDVQSAEKEIASDGSLWPAAHKMVKALARSAAGQDAPLPMDVRSPAALRRTLDYLLHTVLGDEGDLPTVHGFLWDRTRAIRRDFVFQSSMSSVELSDQVYCLERITRFHVIALHQMSRPEVVAEDFSEQQEVEQLGKALLSLIHAYEDCQVQGIHCENEAEFRAYYVLFNSHNSGILETVQDWGWKLWGESDEVRTAVSLVETLQNIWDTRGPLKPHSATDIAQNGYSRFFSIIEDKKVSYTMACFAEIHFNSVRKSALKTILASYRKQRDQTKDWTLTKLNAFLRFDDEEDIIDFGEAYGLQFEDLDDESCLSFESEDAISDPFPPLKQPHSYCLVERKRGDHPLPAVIDATVYEDSVEGEEASDEDSLFVQQSTSRGKADKAPGFLAQPIAVQKDDEDNDAQDSSSTPPVQSQPILSQGGIQNPTSIFNGITTPKTFSANFFVSNPGESSSPSQAQAPQESASISSKPPGQVRPSIFTPSPQPQPTKSFSLFPFTPQPATKPASEGIKSSFSLGQHTVTASPPTESPKAQSSSGQNDVTAKPLTESPKAQFPLEQYAVTSSPPPTESLKAQFSLGQYAVTASPPAESPKPTFFFGQHSITPPIQPPVKDAPGNCDKPDAPSNQIKQSPWPQTFGTGPVSNPVQKPVLNDTTQQPIQEPKLPAPPAQFQSVPEISPAEPPAPEKRKVALDQFAKWVALGDGGLIDQFTAFTVERILRDAVSIFVKEETELIAKEEDDFAREQADQFRYRSLATKYGHFWRATAHRMWLKRRGRKARKARQEMAESLRASKAAQSANIVEDFRASTGNHRRGSLESLLDATGVLDGVHDANSELRAITQSQATSKRRRRSDRSIESPASVTNTHKQGKSDNPLRRSLLSDPSYLHGGSRIHLMSKYDAEDEIRPHASGVQTDYFRLKARGITTLPNGTALANSAAKHILHKKRSFDGISRPTTPNSSKQLSAARSVPAKSMAPPSWRTSTERDDEIQSLKARAKAVLDYNHDQEESRQKKQKRTFDDDAELFARAKRIREQMDEGLEWYRKTRESSAASRSVS